MKVQIGLQRQVVRCDSRKPSRMDRDIAEQGPRFYPNAVERQHGATRRKSSSCRCRLEVRVQPTQRAAPQKPFVYIADEYRRQRAIPFEPPEQPLDLLTPLRRAQAEMGGKD